MIHIHRAFSSCLISSLFIGVHSSSMYELCMNAEAVLVLKELGRFWIKDLATLLRLESKSMEKKLLFCADIALDAD